MNEKDFFITGFIINYVSCKLALDAYAENLIPGYTAQAINIAEKAWTEYLSQLKGR